MMKVGDILEENENFQAFLDMLKNKLSKERVQILNPKRVSEMEYAYKTLSKIVLGIDPDAKINCGMNEMNDGSGCIEIETDEIIVYNADEFIKGIENASNFEVYPLNNGKIKMAFMFYGVMTELT